MSQRQNNTPLLLSRCLPGFHLGIFFTNRRAPWPKSVSTNQLTSALLMLPSLFYDKLYNYLSRLLSCVFSGYCRLFLYMSSKHFVRQGKKAFVQQYQKLYRLLMKVSMVFQYLQASKRRWLALHYVLWSLLLQRLVVVIPKAPFTSYIKSFAFGRFVFQ